MDLAFVLPCTLLLFTNSAYVLLIEGSQTARQGFAYSFLLFLLLTSLLKALVSSAAIALANWRSSRGHAGCAPIRLQEQVDTRLGLLSAGSAALYAVNDVLVFKVMSYFPSASYSVLVTGKIAVVALLSRILLRKTLSRLQIIACVLLTVGIINFQYDFCGSESSENQVAWEGYFVVLVAEVLGGSAGILNEVFLNQSAHLPVHCHNLLMYGASIVLYTIALLAAERPRLSEGRLFGGWTSLVTAMVIVNSVRGISVSLIFKNSTNMTKVFIVIPGIIVTWLWSSVFYGFEVTLQAVLAIVVIMLALWMYASEQQRLADEILDDLPSALPAQSKLSANFMLPRSARRNSTEELVRLNNRGSGVQYEMAHPGLLSAGGSGSPEHHTSSLSLLEEESHDLWEWESLRSVFVGSSSDLEPR